MGSAEFIRDIAMKFDGDECLIWPLRRKKTGYGALKLKGKTTTAHRVICREAHGDAPTPRHQAAHSCGKGHEGCVNPRHLSWKTARENQIDRIFHGTGSNKLSVSDALDIKRSSSTPSAELAQRYAVSVATIHGIRSGRKWAFLDESLRLRAEF